ncbi:MAG: LemA family protein [Neisseria sp.]|nr:LemA family protein [Neisseria sp.]
MGLLIALLLLGILVVWPAWLYNKLVRAKNQYLNAFAQIQVQLKRRHELIPNLVDTVRAYLVHERETLEAVTAARSRAEQSLRAAAANPDAASMRALADSETALNGALQGLNVAIEAYPELRAQEAVLQLNEALDNTENRVAFARQAYNDAVMHYNTSRQLFPANMLSGFFGHKKDAALLKLEQAAELQTAPRVQL